MNKFKVGDLIIGTTDGAYSITNSNVICKVIEVYSSYLTVKCVKTLREPRNDLEQNVNYNYYNKYSYDVNPEYFRRYREKGNISIW